jgi:beta-galactosidase
MRNFSLKGQLLCGQIIRPMKEIKINGKSRSILLDRDYTGNFTIAPYEPEFIEIR